MAIDVKITDDYLRIIQTGARVTKLKIKLTKEREELSSLIEGGNLAFYYRFGTSFIKLTFQEIGKLVVIDTEETLESDVRVEYVFHPEFEMSQSDIFIPSIWYKDNKEGLGSFPKASLAPFWSFDESRMSIPSLIEFSSGANHLIIAKKTADSFDHKACCGWRKDEVYLARPSVETPYSYCGKKSLIKNEALVYTTKEECVKQRLYCFNQSFKTSLQAYEEFVKNYNRVESISFSSDLPWEQYAVSKLTRLLNLVQADGFLLMGEGNGDEQEVYEYTSASFLVKSIEAAACFATTPLCIFNCPCEELKQARLKASVRLGFKDDEHLLVNIAIKIGNYFLKYEDNGRFQDCVNIKTGENGGYLGIGEHPEFQYLINARCNGEAMKAYLALYSALKEKSIDKPEFLEIAKRVAVFYLEIQLSNGSFGRWWSKSGKPENIQGTNGAYIAIFLIQLLKMLEEEDSLYERVKTGIRRAMSFYKQLIEEGLFYGDTLDADSSDKEAGVVLLDLMLTYAESSHDTSVLEVAHIASQFVLTWIWQADCVFKKDSPLDREQFHTAGLSAVSIAHNHLDFYGMLIATLFLRYTKLTGDNFYREQANLMLNASKQLIANSKNLLGRSEKFVGWQPEQINHTNWDYFNNSENMNGTYSIDISWVNVLGYSAYLYCAMNSDGDLI